MKKKNIGGGLHTRRIPYFFKQDGLDFFFQWILGAGVNGGSTVGECFYTASRMRQEDADSWVKEWKLIGARVEGRGKTSLDKGHTLSARECYFRAYVYHRASLLLMNPLNDGNYEETYSHAKSCFQQAAGLMDKPVLPVSIKFEDTSLPGYFFKPDGIPVRRPTLIMIGGGDTFVEDLYYYIVPPGLKRNYNVLIIDLPGQGILPSRGLPLRADVETPMKHVLDFLVKDPDVDLERIAAFGISGGGFLVPRAASYEKRIKAVVANSMVLSFYELWRKMTRIESIIKIEGTLAMRILKWFQPRRMKIFEKIMSTYQWRWGVRSNRDILEASKPMTVDPAQITCPVLLLIGQSEYEDFPWSKYCQESSMREMRNPLNKLVVTPIDEGADGHSIGTNISLMSQEVFNWLDEVFRRA